MRFSSPSSVLSKEGKGSSGQLSPRLRKKHKRLDAICEREYSRNHGDLNEGEGGVGTEGDNESQIRRSSRVRRAPVLLDVSPPPRKKRKKFGNNKNVKSSPAARDSEDLDASGVWISRLRSRGGNSSFRVKEEGETPRGKRKVFFEEGELGGEKGEAEVGKCMVVKSKRKIVKATNASKSGVESVEVIDSHVVKEEEGALVNNFETTELLEKVVEELSSGENQTDVVELVAPSENNADFTIAEQTEKQSERVERQSDAADVVAALPGGTEGPSCHSGDAKGVELDEQPRVNGNDVECDERVKLGKLRIKEGRRCGLCGGGTDGKPPKPLAQDTAESGNEVYSGSSGSEDPNYDIWDGFGDEPSWLGRLLGPINDRYGIAGTWVHQHCAVWSPEVYFAGLGCLKNVRAALCRGRVLKCTRCGRPGATIGCRVDRCPRTYHLPCARANGCIFDHRKFLIACTDHRHLFQPHGLQYLARIKKAKAKKRKLELRKLANDASRKDIEAEEKWLENCGEDEEFLKRESKRLHRDLVRIAPVYIGGKDSENGKLFEGWESVAGLQDVIQCMKEVVILPLLYPEFFDNLALTPPRGVLLHGHPGTGKTLVVRALIGACARGDKRIAYFARKGADCLGKYVGDAERQLRLLFQVAEKCQPSIIFFDEIDGLAPCRTRRQDQTHSSVVSTLLALMDGLKSRGSVVVIGATNRPDAIDPALRRPGRFDREIYFPLPSLKDRGAILSLHTQRWPKQVTGSLLEWVARKTAGFAGADLQALCTQAAIIGLKRNFPLQETLSAAEKRASCGKRLPLPNFAVEERDWLEALSHSPPPCSRREAGIAANDVVSSSLPCHLIPCLLQPLTTLLVSLHLDESILLPAPLCKAASIIKSVMVSNLKKKKLQSDCWWSFLDDFIGEGDVAMEIETGFLDSGILLGDYSITSSNDLNAEPDDNNAIFKPHVKRHGMNLLQPSNRSGFRLLIAGNPRSGQKHLASSLVHCFVGNAEIQKVDLATISQEGHGDLVHGIAEILMKCAGVSSSMVFMPRIDLWAMEIPQQVTEESDSISADSRCLEKDNSSIENVRVTENANISSQHKCKTVEESADQGVTHRASVAWSLFVEQVESICISTPLTILATSEVPYSVLPIEIRQFFMKRMPNSSRSTLAEHTIPRFVVQVDGKFDHDSVINISATKLSKDVVQLLVQLIHQRSHVHVTSSVEYRAPDFVEDHTMIVNPTTDHESGVRHEARARSDEESVPRTHPPPNARTAKGRSNLYLAICSFGYQILRYPHFAELCWVTSKLKDGPSADVSGPWKGWPFNSCIIRPSNSQEKIVVGSSSGSVRNKEKSGFVRGLVAVGLSAYRGEYTSLREVSFEVRKVLELLVTQINEKVRAGKDRCQYVRLSSQVAYLEDKVNSWAYSLQSLELDAPATIENSKINADNAPDNHVQSEEGKPYVSSKLNESEVHDGNPQGLGDGKVLSMDLNKEDGYLSHFYLEGGVSATDGSLQKVAVVDNSLSDKPINNSEGNNQSAGKFLNQQNGTLPKPSLSENYGNGILVDGDCGVLERSNGFACTASSSRSEDGSGSAERGDVKCSSKKTASSQIPGFVGDKCLEPRPNVDVNVTDLNLPSSEATKREDVCLYRCCSECVNTLLDLAKNILVRRCELDRSSWTVDDVHDVVASLSVDLISVVRKVYVDGKICSTVDGKQRTCCADSENGIVVPVDCRCHSKNLVGTIANEGIRLNTRAPDEMKFLFRNGVLVQFDPDKEACFHCRFETICLCTLINSIQMINQTSD